MTIEDRIEKLEKLVDAILKRKNQDDFYNKSDINGTKAETEKTKRESKEASTLLEEALCDIDTAASDRLADLEEALCELSEIMEEGGNENG